MAKIAKNLLIERLESLNLEKIAEETKFKQRSDQKIELKAFLVGFMVSFMAKNYSLSGWASAISLFIGKTVTKQSLQEKFYDRHLQAVQAVLKAVLGQRLRREVQGETREIRKWKIFEAFPRVWIEDSTCQKVDTSLSTLFSPTQDGKGHLVARMRIQTIYDLVQNCFVFFKIESYCKNDQSAAENILTVAQKGDLILRDRGYFVLEVLRKIHDLGIYFLSLWKPEVALWDSLTQKEINLCEYLRKIKGNGVDIPILLGKKARIPVRLVCLRLPDDIAGAKRRNAKEKAPKKSNHSEVYYELLGWNIFVTNVPSFIWSVLQISFAYRVRWRIETIFKCWKSVWNFKEFALQTHLLPSRVNVSIHIILLQYALLFDTVYNYFHEAVRTFHLSEGKKGTPVPELSMLKTANLIQIYFNLLILPDDWKDFIPLFYKFATYEKREDRLNFENFTYSKN
jgi:Transposase DDE domain